MSYSWVDEGGMLKEALKQAIAALCKTKKKLVKR
jgi:hypothetical protein